jgi:lysine decarboxylase
LVAELPEPATLTFCLGLAKQRTLRAELRKQWTALRKSHQGKTPFPPFEPPPLPLVSALEMSPSTAWNAARQTIPLEAAEDQVSAELLCPYPPGIPLLVPGERLDGRRLTWLLGQQKLWGKQIPEQLMVIEGMKSHQLHV